MKAVAALVVMLAAPGAGADPVEVRDETRTIGTSTEACGTWVRPFGDQYRWTFICGVAEDSDADGLVDSRSAYVFRAVCDGDGSHGLPAALVEIVPDPGTPCESSETVADGPVTPSELTIDLEAGVAMLRADLGSCSLDLAWHARAEAETDQGFFVIWGTEAGEGASAHLVKYDTTTTERASDLAGAVCPAAEVDTPPDGAWISRTEFASRTIEARVDPAG